MKTIREPEHARRAQARLALPLLRRGHDPALAPARPLENRTRPAVSACSRRMITRTNATHPGLAATNGKAAHPSCRRPGIIGPTGLYTLNGRAIPWGKILSGNERANIPPRLAAKNGTSRASRPRSPKHKKQ